MNVEEDTNFLTEFKPVRRASIRQKSKRITYKDLQKLVELQITANPLTTEELVNNETEEEESKESETDEEIDLEYNMDSGIKEKQKQDDFDRAKYKNYIKARYDLTAD